MSLTTRNNVHEYGGVEHTQPGPFDDCLLCKIATLEAELVALREVNSWALKHVPDTTASGKKGSAVDSATDEIRLYAENIIAAPDEWTPHFTRSELLPMARAYVEIERYELSRQEDEQRIDQLLGDLTLMRDAIWQWYVARGDADLLAHAEDRLKQFARQSAGMDGTS